MKVDLGKNDLVFASGVEGGEDTMFNDSAGIACDDQINASGRCVRREMSRLIKDLFHITEGDELSKLLASKVFFQFTAPEDR